MLPRIGQFGEFVKFNLAALYVDINLRMPGCGGAVYTSVSAALA
jgi:hypothetical protein